MWLRYSPQLFAREATEMFEHDPVTNRLRLRAGKTPPWLRQMCKSKKDLGKTWLYCSEIMDEKGVSVAAFLLWLGCAFISLFTPILM